MADKIFSKIKKFIAEKKVDKNFKHAGPGHKLTDGRVVSSPLVQPKARSTRPADPQQTAAAALARIQNTGGSAPNRSKNAIRQQAQRELEREATTSRDKDSLAAIKRADIDERDIEAAPVLTHILFTCALLGEDLAMSKDEMHNVLDELLRDQLHSDEGVTASVLMIQSLNTGRDRRKTCIETLHKYITNVVQSPHEEKYRKIRCENRVFVDRVASLRGGREFLAAVGFEETPMAGADGKVESYFHMSEEKATANLQKLKDSLTVLTDTQPIALKLFRNPVVLTQAKADETEKLPVPNEFFDLTVEEMRRALDERQTELDQMLTLRTREMRERDETLRRFRYKYAFVCAHAAHIQGTFNAHENLEAVRTFIRQHVISDWAPFNLYDPTLGTANAFTEGVCARHTAAGLQCAEMYARSLGDLSLMPAAVLRFEWDIDVLHQWQKTRVTAEYLNENALKLVDKSDD